MSNTLKGISGRIDPEKISVLRNIKGVADELGINFLVVGAFAHDVLFEHIHGIPTLRATGDFEIAVEVASWDAFPHGNGRFISRQLVREQPSCC